MIELLSIIPATAWSAIVTAIITSTIAFLGISYTNKQTLIRMKAQHDHEINLRDKEVMRERAEELYVNVRNYGLNLFTSNMPYYEVMLGNITFNQALDLFIESNKDLNYDISRIHMISEVYFPQISREIKSLIEFNGQINDIVNSFKVKYKKGITADLESAEIFINKTKELTDRMSKLENNIAVVCKNV